MQVALPIATPCRSRKWKPASRGQFLWIVTEYSLDTRVRLSEHPINGIGVINLEQTAEPYGAGWRMHRMGRLARWPLCIRKMLLAASLVWDRSTTDRASPRSISSPRLAKLSLSSICESPEHTRTLCCVGQRSPRDKSRPPPLCALNEFTRQFQRHGQPRLSDSSAFPDRRAL